MIIRRGKHTQIIRRRHGRRIFQPRIPHRRRILCNRRLLHIVPHFGPDQKPIMTEHSIDMRGRTLENVEKGTGVEIGLFEVEVGFGAVGGGGVLGGQVVG